MKHIIYIFLVILIIILFYKYERFTNRDLSSLTPEQLKRLDDMLANNEAAINNIAATDLEAIINLSSMYKDGELKVNKLHVVDSVVIDKNLEVKNNLDVTNNSNFKNELKVTNNKLKVGNENILNKINSVANTATHANNVANNSIQHGGYMSLVMDYGSSGAGCGGYCRYVQSDGKHNVMIDVQKHIGRDGRKHKFLVHKESR